MNHRSLPAEGTPQQPHCQRKVSEPHGLPDAGTADPLPIAQNGGNGRHLEPVMFSQAAQSSHIARTVASKMPVLAHGNLSHPAGRTQFPDELFRAHGRQRRGKLQAQHHLHAHFFQQGELLMVRGHNGCRNLLRTDVCQRMTAKRQYSGNSAVPTGAFHRSANHRRMADMQPVKHPHGPVHGGGHVLQLLELLVNKHAFTWQSGWPPVPPGKALPGTTPPWARFSGFPP